MSRSNIKSPRWLLPEIFATPLQAVQQAVDQLKASVGIPHLQFTLDGRFIGDLGEAIAAHYFNIRLNSSQSKGHDAILLLNGVESDVEVKLRRNSSTIWFDSEPTHLIAFRLEPGDRHITLAYAGSGNVIRTRIRSEKVAFKADGRTFTSRQNVSLNQLAKHFDYATFIQGGSIPFRNQPDVVRD